MKPDKTQGQDAKPAGAGRPTIGDTAMRKVLVTLDEETIEKAKKLGKGNLSAGIRAAFARPPPKR